MYSYISTSQLSKPFHNTSEKWVKGLIGEFRNPFMDVPTITGKWHRWKIGHDPVDIARSIFTDPFGRGFQDTGHFITDLFTKDGLPLPGMGKEYLGESMVKLLESLGVNSPIKWLNMNGFDYIFGGGQLIEASSDLNLAMTQENIKLDFDLWLDTFGEGALDVYLGLNTANIALLSAGIMEFSAGLISAYKSFNYVEPSLASQILEALPSASEIGSAFGFYVALATMKAVLSKNAQYSFIESLLHDVSISTVSYCITKSLIQLFFPLSTPISMFFSILIGGGSSLLMRKLMNSIRQSKTSSRKAISKTKQIGSFLDFNSSPQFIGTQSDSSFLNFQPSFMTNLSEQMIAPKGRFMYSKGGEFLQVSNQQEFNQQTSSFLSHSSRFIQVNPALI